MARWGKVDYRQLKRLQERMQKLEKIELEKFCEAMAKEIAARMLGDVIRTTHVITGNLRRNWRVDTVVERKKDVYEITVYNPTEYAAYYEYGHRTRNHRGWVVGVFTMTNAANKLQERAPKIIERKLMKLLGDAFNGD